MSDTMINHSFMKKLLLTLLCSTLLICSCSNKTTNQDPEMIKDMLSELDSLSFDDAKQKFLEDYEQFMSFVSFFEKQDQKETKRYTLEEEKKNSTKPFSLTINQLSTEQLVDNITAKHSIPSYYSFALLRGENLQPKETVKAELSIDNNLNLGYETSISYIAKKLYYKDGTTKDVDIEARSVGFGLLDSVSLLVSYQFYKDLDTRTISAGHKIVTFDNNTIKLDEIDDNYVKYVIEGQIANDLITSRAKTKNDIWVSSYQSSYSPFTRQESKAFADNIRNKLGKIADKVKNDEYKTKEDFIADLKSSATSINFPSSNKKYVEANYSGNVSEIYLYFGKNKTTEEFYITIPVEELISNLNLFTDSNTRWSGIVDKDGNILIKPDSIYQNMYQLNDFYYVLPSSADEEVSYVYRLDTLNKNFIKQNYTESDVRLLSNSLLGVVSSDKYGAVDCTGKFIIPINYSSLTRSETEPRIRAHTGDYSTPDHTYYTLFDLNGNKLSTGIGYLYDFQCGIALIKQEDSPKCQFINTDGKIIGSVNGYDQVNNFSDNLSRVTKDEKTGYIDKTGKIIIPLIYDDAHDFHCGIALVKKDGKYGLINKQNQVIVPFRACTMVATRGSGKDTYYTLDNESFNAYGLKEEDK